MKKQSIIATPDIEQTAALETTYGALQAAITTANTASALLNEAFGSLCESDDFIPAEPAGLYHSAKPVLDQIKAKKLEREQRRITYYGCKLRLLAAIEEVAKNREELVRAIDALRKEVDGIVDLKLQKEAARCNVIFANTLSIHAHKLLRQLSRSISYGLHPEELWASGKRIDLNQSLAAEYDRSRHEWVVMSSGHGSDFRFDGEDGTEVPEGPYLSFDEAQAEGISWELIADTIGGGACLYNVRTGERVSDF